jgi:heptaprenyl diphosphate synthase
MSPPSGGSAWLRCSTTRAALPLVEELLLQAAAVEDEALQAAARSLIARGGKRLRPALVFLAAGFGDRRAALLPAAAAALELAHVASLYHDDVMDRAVTRRGGPSANRELGNPLATVVGTYLFARASALAASLGDAANRLVAGALAEVCAGQLQEVEDAYDIGVSEARHLETLTRKTGALFELPVRLGCLLGGVEGTGAAALLLYARHLGLAFQLADDALDLAGQAKSLGKATGTDLRQGVYSLAVIRALACEGEAGERLRETLGQMELNAANVALALRLIEGSGAIASAMGTARAHAHQARQALAPLPGCSSRRSLGGLAEYAVARSC